jgi:hypothetical protein
MKKIAIAMVLILPLFFVNNVKAQNAPPPQDFQADLTVASQYTCPTGGDIDGYIPVIGSAYEEYYQLGNYILLWQGSFPGYQPCTVEVTTDKNSQGQYCHGVKTRNVSLNDNDITVNLDLIAQGGGGGNEQ